MAEFEDLPIEDVEQDYDTPVNPSDLPDYLYTDNPRSRNYYTAQAAAIESSMTEKTLFESFLEISRSQNDPKVSLSQKANERSEYDRNNLREAYLADPGASPEDAQENLAATEELMHEIDQDADNEELQFVRAVSQGNLTPEAERELAFQLKAERLIQDTWDSMSWGQVAWDGLELLVPGNILKGNKELTGSYFSAREYMENFVTNFKSLPVEEQTELLPHVRDWLRDNLDNDFKVMDTLSTLVEPGEDGLAQFDKFWALFDVADMTLITGSLGVKLAKLSKRMNAVRALQRAGGTDNAADVAAASTIDNSVREAANLEPDEVANIVTGMDTGLDAAYAGGLSTESLNRIKTFERQTRELSGAIGGEDFVLKEGLLQKQERARAEKKFEVGMQEIGIENLRVKDRKSNATVYEFDEKLEDGSTAPRSFELQLTLDNVGLYEQAEVGVASRFLTSPNVWAKGKLRDDVKAAIRGDTQQARIFRHLVDMQREATRSILGPAGLKGLNPRSRRKLAQLDHVLRTGDEREEIYTPLELKAGVDGVKLDDNQIEAYYKIRSLADNLFFIRNAEERRSMQIRGLKEIVLDERTFARARPMDINGARSSLRQTNPRIVWHMERQRFENLEDLDLAELYGDGYQIARFSEPEEIPGTGQKVNYIIAREPDFRNLSPIVLHYRKGYIPKVNLNVQHFVKKFENAEIDGKTVENGNVTTIRMFDNKTEADQWAKEFRDENPGVEIRVVGDRQLEEERRANIVDGPSFGGFGVNNRARSREEIPFGLEGRTPDRLGAFESLSRNIAAVSRYVARNEWRLGMEQRILNTANNIMPQSNFQNYNALRQLPDTPEGKFIGKLVNQLDEWMGMPSKEEQLFSALMGSIYEKTVGSKFPGMGQVRNSVGYLRHKDPINAARAASFNLFLGWFNPAHLFVQGSGAAVNLSVNIFRPKELARVYRGQTALAVADYAQNEKTFRHVAKSFGMDVEELQNMTQAWKRSGLRDGILTTADHAASLSGRGTAVDGISRLAEKGRLFYTMGELFNRRTAYVTAWREFVSRTGRKVPTTEEEREILTRANNMLLNMHAANKAMWQKGFLSLPTQFMQVSTKTLESLLGVNGSFTRAERARILFSQTLLYGAAGIPIGGMAVNALAGASGKTQADIERMDPATVAAINEGFVGWLTMAMFESDAEVAPRFALIRSIAEYGDTFLFQDTTAAELFLGAFGSSASRFWDGITKTLEPLSAGLAGVREINYMQAVNDIGQTASSWNNMSKALFMHRFDRLTDKSGRTIAENFNTADIVMQAIGFSPEDVAETYELADINRAKEQLRSDVVDSIVETMWDYSNNLYNETITEDKIEETRRKMAILYQTLDTERERRLAREEVQRRLTEGDSRHEREWRRFRRNFHDGTIDHFLTWRQKLLTKGLLREGVYDLEDEE